MYEHNALGYRSGLALCLTKVRSSRARCPATALIFVLKYMNFNISICLLILKVCFLILYKHKLIILVVVPLVYKYKNKLYKTYFPKLYV